MKNNKTPRILATVLVTGLAVAYIVTKIDLGKTAHIIGNPFAMLSVAPDWLVWNGDTVHQLAQHIYDNRTFDRLFVLADALEDAGCTDSAILEHCRSGGEHFRGCWVVDLLLGKT